MVRSGLAVVWFALLGSALASVAAAQSGEPSASCAAEGGTALPDQHALGQLDFWANVSQPSSGRINVCVRVRAATAIVGGRLEINASNPLGVGPHLDASSTDVSTAHCPQQIHESGSTDRIYTSAPGESPIKVCVTLLGTSRRIEIGTTSTPGSPLVSWVPDSDTRLVPDSPPPPPPASEPEANGSDCSYTTNPNGPVAVQAGPGGTPGSAETAVGVCLNTADVGGSVEAGTGDEGTYVVFDGDNENPGPYGNYWGLSSYEDGTGQDTYCPDGPDQGEAGSTNSGGCILIAGALYVDLTSLPIRPICGDPTGGPSMNTWNNTGRDGCDFP